jgi:hypothetical protein
MKRLVIFAVVALVVYALVTGHHHQPHVDTPPGWHVVGQVLD